MVYHILEVSLNTLTDDEIIKEIAAAYESSRKLRKVAAEDLRVLAAKEQLKEAMQPFKDREAYFKKYIKTLASLALIRGLDLKIKEVEE